MNDELDPIAGRHTDFEHPAGLVGADKHREVVELKDSDRVPIGVKHVVVGDSMPSSAV